MNLEDLVAQAITEKTEAQPAPVPDLESIQRTARRRRKVDAGAVTLAVAGFVSATAFGLSALGDRAGSGPPEPPDTPTVLETYVRGTIAPGTYITWFLGSDQGKDPQAVVDVPYGFDSTDGWYLSGHAASATYDPLTDLVRDGRSLALWTVTDVNTNPCYGVEFANPGPTVQDLAGALAAQPVFASTEPAPVSLGGYDGLYLERTFPTDLKRRSCVDGDGSPRTRVDLLNQPGFYFDAWRVPSAGNNGDFSPGQVDRIWILDVAGHRLVVVASYDPGNTPLQIAELDEMVASIRFTNT